MREGDTLARLGGDEFVMMIEGLSAIPEEAAAQSKLIGEKILRALNQPYPLCRTRVAQYAKYRSDVVQRSEKTTWMNWLKRADLVLCTRPSRPGAIRCASSIRIQAAVTARTALESDMRIGLRDGQFVLHYQLQVDSRSRMIGVEALLRWRHPVRGLRRRRSSFRLPSCPV